MVTTNGTVIESTGICFWGELPLVVLPKTERALVVLSRLGQLAPLFVKRHASDSTR
jgi:hypothetical protein